MSENVRTSPLRLRPSEHRTILFIGDLLMAVASVFAAIETWRRFNISAEIAKQVAKGLSLARAEQIVAQTASL